MKLAWQEKIFAIGYSSFHRIIKYTSDIENTTTMEATLERELEGLLRHAMFFDGMPHLHVLNAGLVAIGPNWRGFPGPSAHRLLGIGWIPLHECYHSYGRDWVKGKLKRYYSADKRKSLRLLG